MATTYKRAPEEVYKIARELIEKHHPNTDKAGVKFDILFATSDSGHALKCHGWPANAVVRIVGPVERAKGAGDAEIRIDADIWESLTEAEQAALVDHELYHVMPVLDDASGEWKRDAYDRPKLKMRPHDMQVGWFTEIANRHGESSMERKQAREIFAKDGQAFFPFLMEPQPEFKVVQAPSKKAA